jgi:NADPH-dependent ferric siderophore reductase
MNILTQRAIAFAETTFFRTATVLAVRAWEPGSILEIDLNMPECDMSKWNSAQHIKCKVGVLSYRDYTPSGWDAETHTCTLLIHVAHDGAGSRWARSLRPGDTLSYRKPESSHHHPVTSRMCFLGDETTIGHFLALQQLAQPETRISGAILLTEPHHEQEFHDYFQGWAVAPMRKHGDGDYRELGDWVDALDVPDHADTVFYLAGYIPGVADLRRRLRRKGFAGGQVKAQGFWD